jgi:hypothetical protein
MVAVLTEASFELDGIAFGSGTEIVIEDVDFGPPDIRATDVERPRADGIMVGRDYRGGRLLTFDLVILTSFGESAASGFGSVAALDVLDRLEAAWLADGVRGTAGAVSALRYRLGGRQRVVYGRGRKLAAVNRFATLGRIPVTATFQTVDHLFYDDQERANLVPYVPPPAGGLTWPIVFPWSTITVGYSPGVIAVTGSAQAWLVISIAGPIVNPAVEWVGGWTLGFDLTLQVGETLVIDSRPWSRGVRRNNTVNMAGALTPASPRLSDVRLPPGVHEVVLSGRDNTGTASMTVIWRPAHTSP